jgi:hypothetical protein
MAITFLNGISVEGLMTLDVDVASTAAVIKNTNQNGSGLTVWAANGGGGNNTILRLGTSAEVSKLVVTESGKMGIGGVNPSQLLDVFGNMRLQNQFYDNTNSQGNTGQILSSTAAGTAWINAPVGTITGVTAGTALTGGGTSGNVTLNVSTGGATLSSANIPSSAANRTYVIEHQVSAAQTLVVNVPWTDNNTTYTAGTGLGLSGTQFSINSTVLTTTGSQTISGAKRFNGSILDAGGSSGSSGQVLASTGTGQVDWVAAGVGTIGGTAADTRIAFGSAANTLTSDPDFEVVTSVSGGKRIKVENGGIQIANMTVGASSTTVGSMRYRAVAGIKNESYVDMVMQTAGTVGAVGGTYAWVNIVKNTWT